MNDIVERIFRHRTVNFNKLVNYGFIDKERWLYKEFELNQSRMLLKVKISKQGDIFTEVNDPETGEAYTLFLVENASGVFVGCVRAEYESVLTDIALNCTDKEIFKSRQAKQIIEFIRKKFGDELEYLWAKTPDCAIWRKKGNSKWYGALMAIPKRKLGIDSDEMTEIIDLRMNSEKLKKLVDDKIYFKGYHMNKQHWITICLDNSVNTDEIFKLIESSYLLA